MIVSQHIQLLGRNHKSASQPCHPSSGTPSPTGAGDSVDSVQCQSGTNNQLNDSINAELPQEPPSQRPQRNRRLPARYDDSAMFASVIKEPSNITEALESPEAAFWEGAMEDEIVALIANNTWDEVPAPARGVNIVGSRFVAEGFSQKTLPRHSRPSSVSRAYGCCSLLLLLSDSRCAKAMFRTPM